MTTPVPDAAPSPRRRLATRGGRVAVVGLLVLAVLVGAGATVALAGGFDHRTPVAAGKTTAEPGEAVDTGAFDLTVTSWELTTDLDPDGLERAGADAWLVVAVDVANTDRVTRRLGDEALALPTQLPAGLELTEDAEYSRSVTLVRDGTTYPQFQPGLGEQTLVAWPVLGSTDDLGGPDAEPTLDVGLPVAHYRDMYIGGGRRWAETGRVVTVAVPYGEVPQVQGDEEDDW